MHFQLKRTFSLLQNDRFLYIPSHRGKIHYSEMYDMLKNIDPPLGFGNKCPNRLAYKKLIRMNMPLDEEKRVNFTTTLFALIRENLNIKMRPADEMDQADDELRETIRMIWPFQAKKMLDLLIPRTDRLNKMHLTVGKVYAGLLILESWRNTKFGQIESGIPVSPFNYTLSNTYTCHMTHTHYTLLYKFTLKIYFREDSTIFHLHIVIVQSTKCTKYVAFT